MRARFTQSFKMQAVEKALSRAEGINLAEVAESLGVGYSTLQKWIAESRNQTLEPIQGNEILSSDLMTKEKRPQDWSLDQKLKMIFTCASLDDHKVSELCREQGIYPHHLEQWKLDFANGNTVSNKVKNQSEVKDLKHEIKALKKELNRKDKALAEAAAILVLQKKVSAIWNNDEDDSQ